MRRSMVCMSLAMMIGAVTLAANAPLFSLGTVQLKEWATQGPIQKVVGEKLYDLIDGFADIHMGFRYIDSEHMKIKKGKREFEIGVYRENSPDNAYGLFTCLRQRDNEPIEATDEGAYSPGLALIWRGPYCVEVKDVSEEPATKAELVGVCKAIGEAIEGKNQPPELVRALPKDKLVWHQVMYFHNRHPLDQIFFVGTENVLLLGTEGTTPTQVEAVYATYDLSGGAQGILAIRYPNPEDAKKAFELYTESVRKDMASVNDQALWRVLTAKNGKQTVMLQKGRLLLMALEAPQADAVKPILEQTAKNLEPKKEAGGKKSAP